MKFAASKYLVKKETGSPTKYAVYHNVFGGCIQLNSEEMAFLSWLEKPRQLDQIRTYPYIPNPVYNFDLFRQQRFVLPLGEDDRIINQYSHKVLGESSHIDLRVLYLFVTNACNMRCKYCYVPADLKEESGCLMSWDTAQMAVDQLFSRATANGVDLVTIRFLGGEPFLNFSLLKAVVEYATEISGQLGLSVNFGVNTNATVINGEIAEWASKQRNLSIVVSLDGTPSIHDRCRVFPDGRGTGQVVESAINLLCSHGVTPAVNCVIASHNKDHFEGLLDTICKLGLSNLAIEFASIIPEKALQSGIQPLTSDERLEFFKKAWVLAHIRDVNLSGEWKFAVAHLQNGSAYFCNAGSRALVIEAGGTIYPCPRQVGHERSVMGEVHEEFLNGISLSCNEVYAKWVQRSPLFKASCSGCSLTGIVSGGCPGEEANSACCSSREYFAGLIDFILEQPPETWEFNDMDRQLHGMYYESSR